jgi:hypothetical protein
VTEKRYHDALAEMDRSHFPPGWDPPPREFDVFKEQDDNEFVLFMEAMATCEAPGPTKWVREAYFEKTADILAAFNAGFPPMDMHRLAVALSRIPDGESVPARLEARGRSDMAAVLRAAWPSEAKEKK